jgi:hypothetical protein
LAVTASHPPVVVHIAVGDKIGALIVEAQEIANASVAIEIIALALLVGTA